MLKKVVKVMIKRPGEKAKVEEITNDNDTLSNIVGGCIEQCFTDVIKLNIAIIINFEGKLIGLPKNFNIKDYGDHIAGNAIFVKRDTNSIIDLTDEDIEDIKAWIEEQSKVKVNSFTKWLDTFLNEKNFDRNEFISLTKNNCTFSIQYQNIIDYIKEANDSIQKGIKNKLVEIDFLNASISDFFKYLAKAIYFNS